MSISITPNLDSVSLYFREGTSDKEYHLDILGSESEGFRVQYKYGRRGSSLTAKFKNQVPTDYKTAHGIFEHERDKQLREGYTYAESGTPYQDADSAGKVSGILPQLLNFIEEDEVQKYVNDDVWIMQEKKDGVRCMVKKTKKGIEGINKKGLITSLPKRVENAIKIACGDADATLDGELVGEVYWLFDMLSIGVHAIAILGFEDRLGNIQDWLEECFTEDFQLVPTAVGTASKKALYKKLKDEKAEGVVFKRTDSVYKAGRPASGGMQLKFKFTKTATVRVRALNDKASFQMEMLSKGNWIYVGDCTYHPTKYTPKPGDFVEVRYLYAFEGGSLFQPRVKEKRVDSNEDDCLLSQLVYKQGGQEDDDN